VALAEESWSNLTVWGAMPEHRFVILAQGRTGSTLLTSLLDSHPQIRCNDELLQRPRLAPLRYVDQVARKATLPWHGWHLKSEQLQWRQGGRPVGPFLDELEARGSKIIYLWRENVLEQCVSMFFAVASGAWHYRKGKQKKRVTELKIDPEELGKLMDQRNAVLESDRKLLSGREYCEINYERDLRTEEARGAALSRVQEFLGVQYHPLVSELRKSVNRPMHELLQNYDEIAEAFEGTPHAHWVPKLDMIAAK
jgi:LPS sulfotransferase NodH